MRLVPLSALVAAVSLALIGVGTAASQHTQHQTALDLSLRNQADAQVALLDEYFGRARTVVLLTARNEAFGDVYRLAGRRDASAARERSAALRRVDDALAYLESLYPAAIGEACFIDRSGAEQARVVRGLRARPDELSHDESDNPFFAPAFAQPVGSVYQASPYVSPDTREWVIANATPLPTADGSKPAIVHFEVTIESFRRAAAAGGREQLVVVDAATGRVVIDSRLPQRVGARLGRAASPALAALARRGGTAGQLTLDGHRASFRRLSAHPGNQNHWLVVAVANERAGLSLTAVGWAPLTLFVLAAAFVVVALVTFRRGQGELRRAAVTDTLTGLPNRRGLVADAAPLLRNARRESPVLLTLLDLNGFKLYNDTFGHQAGDALLARLGAALSAAVAPGGRAYRLGGDEFCVLTEIGDRGATGAIAAAAAALEEHGDGFAISAAHGSVLAPAEETDLGRALQLADQRMYAHKNDSRPTAVVQTREVLVQALHECDPALVAHLNSVAALAVAVADELGLPPAEVELVRHAAELHDIGKVAIPDQVLEKAGPLDADEWRFIHRHTTIGERIISAAPSLQRVGRLVRSTHERFDGGGYPDRLAGDAIPLGSRIIFACDAFDAMTTPAPYRAPVSPREALEELQREAGAQFDPAVVAALAEVAARTSAPR